MHFMCRENPATGGYVGPTPDSPAVLANPLDAEAEIAEAKAHAISRLVRAKREEA